MNYFIDNFIFLNYVIKIIILDLIFLINNNYLYLYINKKYNINNEILDCDNFSFSSYINNISNFTNIYFTVFDLNYIYNLNYKLIEVTYFIKFYDENFNLIRPSDISLFYNIHILCDIHISKNNENIYSLANIYKNKYFFCIEYIHFDENIKFGLFIYRINDIEEEIEYFEHFIFTENLIIKNNNPLFNNNNKFNISYIQNNHCKLLFKINNSKKSDFISNKNFNLKSSYLKPPLCYLKRDISQLVGKWYYSNIYENYFCFCKGKYCINI